jgi:uncharacterized protein with von Willebrand factor type A (vWA) domain
MSSRSKLGGIVHTYQRYDPVRFPSPSQPPAGDLLSHAFEHLLHYGGMRELTEEELARAVRLDPSMIPGLGPSLDALKALLEERKRKILETYETASALRDARRRYEESARAATPPKALRKRWRRLVEEEQIDDFERLWYRAEREDGAFAVELLRIVESLGDKYQVEELAAKYRFTGREPMTTPQALAVKEELEKIDELLKQIEEARETAQIGVVDLEALAEFAEPGDVERLSALQQRIQDVLRELAERQGMSLTDKGLELTPRAYRLFQSKLLEEIFASLDPGKSGRHDAGVVGEGAVESHETKPYEFGDSVVQMDVPASLVNALIRTGGASPVRLKPEDVVVHKTKNNPKCATCVVMDMSGSMRYDGLYVDVKRMALALEGLIRREFPGDYLQFIEMATFAKPRRPSEIVRMLPRPVTIFEPFVRLRADMSRPEITESMVPPHFTNIQHALRLARRFLAAQDTPNRQIFLITDGLPTAHFEDETLYLLYPPDGRTEEATMREGRLCAREGIVVNLFLLSTWNQSREDVHFAHRLAEQTRGRVLFTAGRSLERFVVWDYVRRKKHIVA